MTNRIALGLGLIIVALIAWDALVLDWGISVFLARKFADLVEYLAFWR